MLSFGSAFLNRVCTCVCVMNLSCRITWAACARCCFETDLVVFRRFESNENKKFTAKVIAVEVSKIKTKPRM